MMDDAMLGQLIGAAFVAVALISAGFWGRIVEGNYAREAAKGRIKIKDKWYLTTPAEEVVTYRARDDGADHTSR